MTRSVLLVVDVQTALIEAISYNKQKTIDNIKELISAARDNQKEVIYVRHDVSNIIGQENDIGKWDIYSEVAPDIFKDIEVVTEATGYCYDSDFNVFYTPAFRRSKNLNEISQGIESMIRALIDVYNY